MNIQKRYFIGIVVSICLALFSAMIDYSFYMIAALICWLMLMIYCVESLSSRSVLFCFLISFFSFLMGRELFEIIGIHSIEISFSDEYNLHAERLVFLSLFFLSIGYFILSKIRVVKLKRITYLSYDTSYYKIVRRVSGIIFWGTFLFNFFNLLDVIRYIMTYGYISYYIGYEKNVPYIISKIGDMCQIALYIFLATMPKKSESKNKIYAYIFYLFITLLSGQRYPLVSGLLTLYIYYMYRNSIEFVTHDRWFGNFEKKLCILLLPFLVLLMPIINIIRVGNEITLNDILNSMTAFFYQQGVSITVIKRALLYENSLPDGKLYMFGGLWDFLHSNIISRMLGVVSYSKNTVEHALEGYSLQHALSYIVMGNYYLMGHGLGSSYIAEAYHDFRYAGVITINLIYGYILKRLFDFSKYNIWVIALSLSMLNSLFLAPRGNADGFIVSFIDLNSWGTIVIVYIISNILVHLQKKITY